MNWNLCTSKCCDSSKSYDYSYSSLQQCDNDKKKISTKTLTIILAVVGGVIGLIVIILICYCGNRERVQSFCLSIGCCRNVDVIPSTVYPHHQANN